MRLLVISDLHANWAALEAVLAAEAYDRLVVGGDLVAYGPDPARVVDFVRRHAALAVRGNHDDALAHGTDCRCSPANRPLADATRAAHAAMLGEEAKRYLGALPLAGVLKAGGESFFAVHATPRDALYRYTLEPWIDDATLAAEVAGVPGIVLLGHTHLPMVRRVGDRLVVNPGSVGQPRDGDPRAAYAVVEDGVPTLRRVAYDVEKAVRGVRELPLARDVVDRLVTILTTGRA
jgi:putative phosphoesterase